MAARRIALLVNPTSGQGRGGKNAPLVAKRLRERGLDVVELIGTSAEESRELAENALRDGVSALVACGGDGTVSLALQAVAGTSTALGIIPVGTGDDNARGLGIPLKDPSAAADVVADGRTRLLDAGQVTTADGTRTWFLGVMSAGFDSSVNERANRMTRPSGQLRYIVAMLAELGVFKAVPFKLTVDGTEFSKKGMLVAVGNGQSYGGGMKVTPRAKYDDGLFDVMFLSEVPKLKFLRAFPGVFKGTHVNQPYVTEFRGKQISLDGPGQICYADGERMGPLPLTAEIVPGCVKVLVPVS